MERISSTTDCGRRLIVMMAMICCCEKHLFCLIFKRINALYRMDTGCLCSVPLYSELWLQDEHFSSPSACAPTMCPRQFPASHLPRASTSSWDAPWIWKPSSRLYLICAIFFSLGEEGLHVCFWSSPHKSQWGGYCWGVGWICDLLFFSSKQTLTGFQWSFSRYISYRNFLLLTCLREKIKMKLQVAASESSPGYLGVWKEFLHLLLSCIQIKATQDIILPKVQNTNYLLFTRLCIPHLSWDNQ